MALKFKKILKETTGISAGIFEITKNTDIKVVYDAVDVTGPAIRPYGVTIIVNQKFDALALFKGYIDSNPGTYRVKVRKQGGSASVTSSSIVKGTKAGTVSLYLQRKEKVGKKNKWVTDTDAYEAVVTIVKCKIPSIRRSMNDIGTTIDLKQLVDNIPSDANISWDIKNPKNKVVASVNSDGVITLQNKGKATIRLTISYGGYSKTVSGKLTVK